MIRRFLLPILFLVLFSLDLWGASTRSIRRTVLPQIPTPPAETVITVNQQGGAKPAAEEGEQRRTTPTPPAIMSIIPPQGEPESSVILSGPGFDETTRVWLGTNELPATILGSEQLGFTIPPLPPGLYALFVKNGSGMTSKTYTFTVLPRKPVITSLSPETLAACSEQREITISGKHFAEGGVVLLDGAIIRSRFVSPESITVTIPSIGGGLHHLQVKNPDESLSASVAFVIESKPEITSITTGAQDVTFYELMIRGNNFQQGSTVVVDGRRIGTGIPQPGDRDRVIYMDCQLLIYQRYPVTSTPRELRIQVVNATGEQSSTFTVSAP